MQATQTSEEALNILPKRTESPHYAKLTRTETEDTTKRKARTKAHPSLVDWRAKLNAVATVRLEHARTHSRFPRRSNVCWARRYHAADIGYVHIPGTQTFQRFFPGVRRSFVQVEMTVGEPLQSQPGSPAQKSAQVTQVDSVSRSKPPKNGP